MEKLIEKLGLDKNKPVILANHYGYITYVNKEFEGNFSKSGGKLAFLSKALMRNIKFFSQL